MRISTSQIYGAGSSGIMDNQSKLYKLQNQLSTGSKIITAKDDPVGAAQVLLNSQSLSLTTQYASNQGSASDQLALEESRITSVVDSVQYIKEQVVAGGNATYSDSQRKFIAQNLQAQLNYLLDMSNSKDSNGYYLFSGYQGNTQPFQQQADGSIIYKGDDGERTLQVSSSEEVAVTDAGSKVFQNIKTGNGTFSTAANSTNTGTGIVSGGSVTNPSSWTGNNYSIAFAVSGATTTYTVTNVKTGVPVLSAQPYTSGTQIAFDGISLAVSGAPANGDTFTVAPSSGQSIFTTVQNLITAFSTPIEGNPTASAAQRNIINTEMNNLDRALENASSVQASVGSRRAELNTLMSASSSLKLQYQTRISNLQDIDYAATISDFSQMQVQLEAAQSAFAKISSMSLFKYI